MPAKPQDWWRPATGGKEAGQCGNVNASPFCTNCNTNQSASSCKMSDPCPACNTKCTSCQAYCQLGIQLIQNHGTVSDYVDPGCMVKDEFIFRNWTADYWNTLQDMLLTADKMGESSPHAGGVSFPNGRAVPDPENAPHPQGSLVTAAKYNDVAAALGIFSSNIDTVVKDDDVIRGAHALAISSAYKSAKFKTTVCDICNGGGYQHAACSCNSACNCYCSCSCGCSCSSGGRG